MEAKLSGKDGNDDFAHTVARLAQQMSRGGRGEQCEAIREMEVERSLGDSGVVRVLGGARFSMAGVRDGSGEEESGCE